MDFQGKHVSIIGLARSGIALAKLLDDKGARVLVSDLKTADELGASLAELQGRDIEYVLGGHDERCLEKAELIVVSPAVPLEIPLIKTARALDIPVIGELELAYRLCQAPIIAITGTKGKSTTTTLIGDILRQARGKRAYNKVYVVGNIGVALSLKIREITSADIVVAEVSSFQLESTQQFHPRVSVILNISTDHLDRHKTMARYLDAKKRIFANQTEQDYIVLNADDVLVKDCANEATATPIFFSRKKSRKQLEKDIADFTGTYIERDCIVAQGDGDVMPICPISDIKLLGPHNLENVLAASAVGMIVVRSKMDEAISNFRGLEHALQFVVELNGIQFINDSKATNVASVRVALEALDNNIILIIGGYDKGNDYSPLVELVKAKVKRLILLGEHTAKIREVLGEHTDTYSASTMRQAVFSAYSQGQKGDYVLLSPANASFDMFTDYRERGNAFREAVKQLADVYQ